MRFSFLPCCDLFTSNCVISYLTTQEHLLCVICVTLVRWYFLIIVNSVVLRKFCVANRDKWLTRNHTIFQHRQNSLYLSVHCKLNNLGWLKPVLPTAARKLEGGTHRQCLNFPLLISLACQQQLRYATGTHACTRQNTSGQQLLLKIMLFVHDCARNFLWVELQGSYTAQNISVYMQAHTDRDSPWNWHL